MQFQGVHTAIVTPFRDGEVDLDAFRALCRRQQEGGVDGLVVCGTTGETPTLAHAEWRALLQAAREAVGDALPLTMGCGTNDTARTVDLLREARDLGADAALVVTPYYNKPSPAGHRAHVAACVDVGLPVMLYHIPGRTGQRLSVELITELCETEGVVALKEATADLTLAQALMNRTDAAMMSGDDFTFAALMAVGGAGVVSVLSNVAPEQTVAWARAASAGDREQVVALRRQLTPVVDYLFHSTNPAPCKAILARMGLCENELRLPLVPVDLAPEGLVAGLR